MKKSTRARIRRAALLWAGLVTTALGATQFLGRASAQESVDDTKPEGAIVRGTSSTTGTEAKPSYTVLTCNDGDTCRLKSSDGVTVRVRLVGIDAPEFGGKKRKGQPLSSESKDFLNGLVQGKSVTLNTLGNDHFGRALGEILIEGKNANLEIVRAGLAEVYRGRPPRGLDADAYARAEAEAKAGRRGVWALQDYQSPKDWRKKNK
jgi:micrococcal nuclease